SRCLRPAQAHFGGPVAGRGGQRAPVGDGGARQVPAPEAQVADERLHVGEVGGRTRAGGGGLGHQGQGPRLVAVQLAQVRGAGEAGEGGPAVDHLLGGGGRLP